MVHQRSISAQLTNTIAYNYAKLPNLVFGFHGCRQETFENVLYKHEPLAQSQNRYDWLGHGIYFWENSYQRALEWASRYEHPAVIGAIIDLGYCLNLTDYYSTQVLQTGYEYLVKESLSTGTELPKNKNTKKSNDWLLRDLDCAVIERVHTLNRLNNFPAYDSVRGIFTEGKASFPGSGFKEKTHVQLCIINPNCIKGYFNPIETDSEYPLP